ncbi:MAG TPA: allantoicase [Ignavibacteria bacterium]|nr:allantoicase [Ignavibacteria bacterium]
MNNNIIASAFAGLTDLASERNGGKALKASDEFFAGKENLLKEGRGIFIPDKFTDRGKWMDGWESRRKRKPGFDWCIIKLGAEGIIKGIDIDTNHFLGNHPPYASVEAGRITKIDPDNKQALSGKIKWMEILPKSPLEPGSQNLFAVTDFYNEKWTHVRLNIYPDGGVARLRVYGEIGKEIEKFKDKKILTDLAALMNGGKVISCNDMFFGSKNNLISPGRSKNMGDGWETKRKRTPGNDWVILKLAAVGHIKKIVVDTNFFKGNYPDSCLIEGCFEPLAEDDSLSGDNIQWKTILPKSKLKGHHLNSFAGKILKTGPFTHVRLNIYPDGGVSRLRLFGYAD